MLSENLHMQSAPACSHGQHADRQERSKYLSWTTLNRPVVALESRGFADPRSSSDLTSPRNDASFHHLHGPDFSGQLLG